MTTIGRFAATLALAGCAAGTGGSGGAPLPSGSFQPEDRVVLGDFSTVQAIAASFDVVYVVYPSAIGIWNPLVERWSVPRAAPSTRALADVFNAVVDPLDRSVWLAARSGLIHFDPLLDRWERHVVPGTVIGIGLDRGDPAGGVWLRSTEGWFHQPRIGGATPGTPPATLRLAPTVEDAYRAVPGLRGIGTTLALGPGLDPGRLTAAAPSASGSGWFVGTSARGAFFVDDVGLRATPLSLGLLGDMVGALVAVPGGVWVTTDQEPGRHPASLAFVPNDLSATTRIEGDPAFGLGFDAARAILPGDRTLWLATDRGVVAVGIDDGQVRRWNETDGLVDQRVLALTSWHDEVIVGTMRGIAGIDGSGEVRRPLPGLVRPVYALHARGDTLWIGTDRGLVAHAADGAVPTGVTGWDRLVRSNTPVLGIGSVADTLVAMTTSDVAWRDPVTGTWNLAPAIASTTGSLRAFHATPFGVWVGGDRGAAFLRADGGVLRTLRVGPDLPDVVTAIASDDNWLWIGTLRGLVRLALR